MSDSYDDYEARMQLAESVREARLSTLNPPNKADTFYLNSEQIIRMAREAGLIPPPLDWPQKYAEALERFANLVAAAEREACAKVCEAYDDDGGSGEAWALRFAQVIRARGEK